MHTQTHTHRAKQADERGAEVFDTTVPDWRGVRHHAQLHAEWARCAPQRDARDGGHPPSAVMAYDPLSLDDPSLAKGKHRQVNVGGVGPVIFSVILFAPPKQLREEVNVQFQERHPDLPPSLSLSKIRRLKVRSYMHTYTRVVCISSARVCAVPARFSDDGSKVNLKPTN